MQNISCISRYRSQVHWHRFCSGVKAFQICRKSGRQNNVPPPSPNYTCWNTNSLSPWHGKEGGWSALCKLHDRIPAGCKQPQSIPSNAGRTNQQYLHFLWMEQVCIFWTVHEDLWSVPLFGGSSWAVPSGGLVPMALQPCPLAARVPHFCGSERAGKARLGQISQGWNTSRQERKLSSSLQLYFWVEEPQKLD